MKKLKLNKLTVTDLSKEGMSSLKGGAQTTNTDDGTTWHYACEPDEGGGDVNK